jgi:lipopolysaccharide export system permease protein
MAKRRPSVEQICERTAARWRPFPCREIGVEAALPHLEGARLGLYDRMVLREIFWPLAVGLLAILQLLVIIQLLQLNEIVFGSAITLFDLLRVTGALAPHFLVVAVPLAFMLGVQLGVGRLAGDRELLALSASGFHPLRLYRVPVAIALLLAVAVGALAHWAEPWGLQELNRVLNRVIKRNLETGLTSGIFNDGLPRFMIYVAKQTGGPKAREWQGVLIEDDVGDGAPLIALAETGRVEDTEGDAMVLRLRDGELHRMEAHGETVAHFAEGTFLVGVQDPVARKNRFAQNEAQLTGDMLRERSAELRAQGKKDEAARLDLEVVRRWAVPFACLAFALLGVPLAVMATSARGGAYLITLGAFVAFYTMSRVSVALAESGWNPWLAGLAPDLVIAAAGIPFAVRIVRRGVAHR